MKRGRSAAGLAASPAASRRALFLAPALGTGVMEGRWLSAGVALCRCWGALAQPEGFGVPPWQPGLCGVAGDSGDSRALKGAAPLLSAPCSRFPSRSPFVSKKQLFVFLFLFSPRGKFHCAIFSGDSSASCSNFALLLALPEGSWGVPGCGGCGRAAVCVQVELCRGAVPTKCFWLQLCVEILGRARCGRAWAVPRGCTPAVRSASSHWDK